jgi:hypothetical protein
MNENEHASQEVFITPSDSVSNQGIEIDVKV